MTVEFQDLGGTTEVVVIHEGFADAAEHHQHVRGWADRIDRLDRLDGVGAAAERAGAGQG